MPAKGWISSAVKLKNHNIHNFIAGPAPFPHPSLPAKYAMLKNMVINIHKLASDCGAVEIKSEKGKIKKTMHKDKTSEAPPVGAGQCVRPVNRLKA